MPPKNINEFPKLYVVEPNGRCTELGKIGSVSFDDVSQPRVLDEEPVLISRPAEATFEVKWNPTIEIIYLLIHGRIPANNWLKAHGWPLRRKARRR